MIEGQKSARITNLVTKNHLSISKSEGKNMRFLVVWHKSSLLTPDGLRVVCAGLDNDPKKIGIHMLEMLAKFRNEGLFDIVVEDE